MITNKMSGSAKMLVIRCMPSDAGTLNVVAICLPCFLDVCDLFVKKFHSNPVKMIDFRVSIFRSSHFLNVSLQTSQMLVE